MNSSYLGREPRPGSFIKLDDVSTLFDGNITEFQTTQNGVPVVIPTLRQCIISLNGVLQESGVSILAGSTSSHIQFDEAPEAGDTFWGLIFGTSYTLSNISDGAVTATKLDSGSVTTVKIVDGAITANKLAVGSVTNDKIDTGAVTTTKLGDGSVTIQKIAPGAVTFDKIGDIASQAEAEAGTSNDKLMTPERTAQAIEVLKTPIFWCGYVVAPDVGGGTATAGSWLVRPLNTVLRNDIPGASLASNQITLPEGTYRFRARGDFYFCDNAINRFFNATDLENVGFSGGGISENTGGGQTTFTSWAEGEFTISASKDFEFQYQVQATRATDGLGKLTIAPVGSPEMKHSDVYIEKIG